MRLGRMAVMVAVGLGTDQAECQQCKRETGVSGRV